MMRARLAFAVSAVAAVGAISGCASVTPTPAALVQAQTLYASLEAQRADQRVEGDMIRARATIDTARQAVAQGQNEIYVDGMASIALRTVEIADAHFGRSLAQVATDSLQRLRLTRQLAAAQARQATLEAERAEAEQRAATANARADSLRRAADAANAQLEQAMSQLQSLVVEMTDLKQTSRGLVISLSDILFDLGQATLKPGADANVRKISSVLKQYPDHKISVEGYTDSTGSEVFNQQLSENRALAVRNALVAGGLDSTVITVHGYGKANPVATNATTDGRQQNRRVEIVVLGAGKLADLMDSHAGTNGTNASPKSGVDSSPNPAQSRDSTAAPSLGTASTPAANAASSARSDTTSHP